jgi:hypothetical protein
MTGRKAAREKGNQVHDPGPKRDQIWPQNGSKFGTKTGPIFFAFWRNGIPLLIGFLLNEKKKETFSAE